MTRPRANKTCNRCKITKPKDEFAIEWNDRFKKHYYRCVCKECRSKENKAYRAKESERLKLIQRKHMLKKNYGLTMESYAKKLVEQNGACAICGGNNGERSLAVDHNHATGEVRGLLCTNCNQLIGHCKESIHMLAKAAMYLQKHNDADIGQLIGILKTA